MNVVPTTLSTSNHRLVLLTLLRHCSCALSPPPTNDVHSRRDAYALLGHRDDYFHADRLSSEHEVPDHHFPTMEDFPSPQLHSQTNPKE
eukprot:scaffold1022_cov196-Alexandrium_tamarense.AAC.23